MENWIQLFEMEFFTEKKFETRTKVATLYFHWWDWKTSDWDLLQICYWILFVERQKEGKIEMSSISTTIHIPVEIIVGCNYIPNGTKIIVIAFIATSEAFFSKKYHRTNGNIWQWCGLNSCTLEAGQNVCGLADVPFHALLWCNKNITNFYLDCRFVVFGKIIQKASSIQKMKTNLMTLCILPLFAMQMQQQLFQFSIRVNYLLDHSCGYE